jgi:hypothetical protein
MIGFAKKLTAQVARLQAATRGHHGKAGRDRIHGDLDIRHGAGGLVTITHRPSTGAPRGEPYIASDAADLGDTSEQEPNYGAGDTGCSYHPRLDEGGVDPFANAAFGCDGAPQGDMQLLWDSIDKSVIDQDPMVADLFDVRSRIPTLRNPVVHFGLDDQFYSGFGPAAIIGCEIGCAAPGAAKIKG